MSHESINKALRSPMASRMMTSFREYRNEHAEAWEALRMLLDEETFELAKQKYLTVPVRIDAVRSRRMTA